MKKFLLLIVAFFSFPVVTFAGGNGADAPQANDLYSQAYKSCMSRAGGVTSNMLDCNGEEYTYQDRLLNATYLTLQKALPAQRQEALKKTQQLWIQYKETTCRFYEDFDGGTMISLIASSCFLDETAKRADLLKYWLFLQNG